MPQFKTIPAVLFAVATLGSFLRAQDLEPRAYSNSPTGLNFIIAGYGHASGSILTDPALPIDNTSIETDMGIFAYAHTLDIFGKAGKIDFIQGYGNLSGHADVAGVRLYRDVTGFSDPLLRLSMIFFGAPALTMEEFKDYEQDWIFGGSLRIGLPLGQYDNDRVVNIGGNRWTLKPELGVSKAYGPWTFEFAPAVNFYTDNDDFTNGKTREQDPIFSTQGSVSYTFRPGMWAALATTYYKGGQSAVDGVRNNDEQEALRLGLTFAMPVTRHQTLKFYANTGFNAGKENDYNAVGIFWQYRWGGGF